MKKSYKLGIIFLIMGIYLILGFFVYKDYIVPTSQKEYHSIDLNEQVNMIAAKEDESTLSMVQNFVSASDRMDAIAFYVQTFNRENNNEIQISLYENETNRLIQKWDVTNQILPDQTEIRLELAESEKNAKRNSYRLEVKESGIDDKNQIVFYASYQNRIVDGTFLRDGEENRGDLCFYVASGTQSDLTVIYTALFLVIFVIILALLVLTLFVKLKLHQLFFTHAVLIGLVYLLLIPAYSAPDEQSHIISAYAVSDRMMFQDTLDEKGTVPVRAEDSWLYYEGSNLSTNTYVTIWNNLMDAKESNEMVSGGRGALAIPKYAYLAPAIGITIARILGLNGIWLLFFARLANLLFYSAVVMFAIKKMPFKKMLLWVIALLPMSLSLAASCSYDTTTNALSLLFIAYVCFFAYEKEKLEKKDWIFLSVVLALLAPIKVIYVLLGILCILIPVKRLNIKKYWGVQRLFPLVFGGASIILFRIAAILTNLNQTSGDGTVIGGAAQGYSIAVVLQRPIHTMAVVLRTIIERFEEYSLTMIGSKLGALVIEIPMLVILGYVILLLVATFLRKEEKTHYFDWKERGVLLLTWFGISMAVLFVFLLTCTEVSALTIIGAQGRYFLPALPVLLLFLGSKHSYTVIKNEKMMMLGIIVLQSITFLEIVKQVSGMVIT